MILEIIGGKMEITPPSSFGSGEEGWGCSQTFTERFERWLSSKVLSVSVCALEHTTAVRLTFEVTPGIPSRSTTTEAFREIY